MRKRKLRSLDRGCPRASSAPIRVVIVVGLICLMMTGGSRIASASGGIQGLKRLPLQATGAGGSQVVLKWQARSPSGEGQWRVYRSPDGQTFTLAETIGVDQGVQGYRFSDLRLRTQMPPQVYQLRYLGSDGEETIVAIAWCTDSGIEDNPATPSNDSGQTAFLLSPALMRPTIDEEFHDAHEDTSRHWRPEPEFPPPRAV